MPTRIVTRIAAPVRSSVAGTRSTMCGSGFARNVEERPRSPVARPARPARCAP
jgi:hypothetical protein